MREAFSSSFLVDKISTIDKTHRGRLLKHFESALGAISYHLERIVPRGSIICAYHPKGILGSILPVIAKEKNCKVITIHGTKHAVTELMKAGVLSTGNPAEADVFLAEPDGLSADGALFKPHEASDLPHKEIIAVASALQFTKERPASHDIAPVYKIVTELGIHSAEHLGKEITSSFSWLASSSALKPSPAPLQPPLRPALIPFPILPERLPIP